MAVETTTNHELARKLLAEPEAVVKVWYRHGRDDDLWYGIIPLNTRISGVCPGIDMDAPEEGE